MASSRISQDMVPKPGSNSVKDDLRCRSYLEREKSLGSIMKIIRSFLVVQKLMDTL